MNVILSGVNFTNKGAEAMLKAARSELTRRIPGATFFLWHVREPYWQAARDGGFIPVLLPIHRARERSLRRRIGRHPLLWSLAEVARARDPRQLPSLLRRNSLLAAACRKYLDRTTGGIDAWLDVSGFAYGDAWGMGAFWSVDPLREYCRRAGRPVIFLPQAWGSFDKPEVLGGVRRLLGAPRTSYYSRDESSSRFLESALCRPPGAIPVSPDIVFSFQGGSEGQGREILRNMGCSAGRPVVGVAPNMRVYERLPGQGTANPYLRSLIKLIVHCIERHEVDVVLQANEIDPHAWGGDDRYLCSQIALAVNRPDRCFMTREALSAESTRALIGRFEFLAGSRFHSFVFGFSQGVPGLAISWAHKYRELFARFGLEDYVLECQRLEADELIAKFEKAWAGRQGNRPAILSAAERMRGEVGVLFDEVAARIHEP